MWLIRLIKCDWLDWISCWLESDGFDDFWFKSLSPWMAIIPNILDSMTPHQQRFWTVLKRIWNGQVMNKHWRKKGIHGYPWVPNKRGLPINPIVYHFMHHSPLPSRFHGGLSNQKWKEYVRLFCVCLMTQNNQFFTSLRLTRSWFLWTPQLT